MTQHEFYTRRAAECAHAAELLPRDRDLFLHMAATYIRIVNDIERRQANSGPAAHTISQQDGPLGLGSRRFLAR